MFTISAQARGGIGTFARLTPASALELALQLKNHGLRNVIIRAPDGHAYAPSAILTGCLSAAASMSRGPQR